MPLRFRKSAVLQSDQELAGWRTSAGWPLELGVGEYLDANHACDPRCHFGRMGVA